MTSAPTSFYVGSASSGQSVRDAIASYRRAQYLVAGSTVASASDDSDPFSDEEAGLGFAEQDIDEEAIEEEAANASSDAEGFIGEFDWDDTPAERAESPATPRATLPFSRKILPSPGPRPLNERNDSERTARNERTPLLRKTISFTEVPHPRRTSTAANDTLAVPLAGPSNNPGRSAALRRRSSAASARSMKHNYGGQSTFGQTLFNSIAILLGIGMLSEPLALAYAGWGTGLVLIVFYGYISCYTAKILAGIILSDPRLRSYADIGRKAFGPRSTLVISILFCLELFAVSVILVTLYADSLHSLIPRYSSDTYKLWGILILIPTVFLPLSLLSYTSILGILSTILVVLVVLIDGVSKTEAPGSMWDPAPTSLGIDSYNHLGIAFGLFMAGFSGHAVIPSLARDMVDPSQFSTMINWAFIVATSIYTLIACAGYRMFGNAVSAEISVDLLATPGYNARLNRAALWMLVISPLSKFALTTQPLNTAIQILLGIDDRALGAPEDRAAKLRRVSVKKVLRGAGLRVGVTLASVAVSVVVPEFSAAMAFLGSFSAFALCVIGPIAAKIALERRCGVFDAFVVGVAGGMAVWGTGAAFVDAAA
ncbi:transmembrane amino acid transporter protein-domain-containing protein [Mycena alexandri]|uniref:Transmembrane amino acid transporter protein-domain-containing protein n=1 Tax=Mycena alexandri TaxID=1745969 RepID=A0AAD6SQR6_9AGAR|nr:transmembrane amino acid transporter protein-domain-containing protein [Mycena alexandri]